MQIWLPDAEVCLLRPAVNHSSQEHRAFRHSSLLLHAAGNDIKELYAPKTTKQRYRQFWTVSNALLARLYSSPLVTVAAIRGACPAGGCCLALCCDVRLMSQETGHIGLNEVALGIPVPLFWARLMTRIIGQVCCILLCQTCCCMHC